MEQMSPFNRRRLLRVLAATGAAALFRPPLGLHAGDARLLPSAGSDM